MPGKYFVSPYQPVLWSENSGELTAKELLRSTYLAQLCKAFQDGQAALHALSC